MKKGFTLVELLVVIVIIGLLMTIAIPAVLRVSNNVKEESYNTKIKMITNAAVSHGDVIKKNHLTNRVSIANGDHSDISVTCTDANPDQFVTADGTCDPNGTYPAYRMTVQQLVDANELSYDEKDRCKSPDCEKTKYDNVIKNPVTGNIINNCYVYIYYKNNRIYAKFDKTTCDVVTDYTNGHEYKDVLA